MSATRVSSMSWPTGKELCTYLIGVEQMEACNHSTFSQAILNCPGDAGISFSQVHGVVTDSVAYCKKAVRDVLSTILPNSTHVLCLAHIVNLAADVFHKYKHFHHTRILVTMIKSRFYKKPGISSLDLNGIT